MSGGVFCRCGERKKPIHERQWFVWQRRCNHSAFSGYRETPSDYSAVRCRVCHGSWRTKADYVLALPDGKLE